MITQKVIEMCSLFAVYSWIHSEWVRWEQICKSYLVTKAINNAMPISRKVEQKTDPNAQPIGLKVATREAALLASSYRPALMWQSTYIIISKTTIAYMCDNNSHIIYIWLLNHVTQCSLPCDTIKDCNIMNLHTKTGLTKFLCGIS